MWRNISVAYLKADVFSLWKQSPNWFKVFNIIVTRNEYIFRVKTRLNRIKIEKTLNRYNSEDNYLRSMDERSLEARNLTLRNAFLFIPIRLFVSEISSCKEKRNFWSFTTSILIVYSDLSLALRLADLSQTADKQQTRFLERRTHFQERNARQWIERPFTSTASRHGNFESSRFDRDIGMNRKAIFLMTLPLHSWLTSSKFLKISSHEH